MGLLRDLAPVYLAGHVMVVGFQSCYPTSWLLVERLGGSKAFYGWTVSAYMLMALASSLVFGKLTTRQRLKPLLLTGFFVSMTGYVLYAFAQHNWMVMLGRLLSGFGFGAFYCVTTHPADQPYSCELVSGRFCWPLLDVDRIRNPGVRPHKGNCDILVVPILRRCRRTQYVAWGLLQLPSVHTQCFLQSWALASRRSLSTSTAFRFTRMRQPVCWAAWRHSCCWPCYWCFWTLHKLLVTARLVS